jgi:hypothetical protein
LGCCKHRSSYPKGCVLFHLFYRVYFASEKHVTRTSKTPYSRRAVNAWFLLVKNMVTRTSKTLIT